MSPPLTVSLALSAIMKKMPPDQLRAVINDLGRAERRRRSLPAWVTAYIVMSLSIVPSRSYTEAMALVFGELSAGRSSQPEKPLPTLSALVRARERLGTAVFEALLRDLSMSVVQGPRVWSRPEFNRLPLPYEQGRAKPIWVLRSSDGQLLSAGCSEDDRRLVLGTLPFEWSPRPLPMPVTASRVPLLARQEVLAKLCVQLVHTSHISARDPIVHTL